MELIEITESIRYISFLAVSGKPRWMHEESRLPWRSKRAQHPRQKLRQILGDQPGPKRPRAGAVQPDGVAGRLDRGHVRREQPLGQTRQDVARTGGGERRRQTPADRGAAIRRSDDAVRSFIDYDSSHGRRG